MAAQMDHVSVREGQGLNTADAEVLAGVSEANSRNSVMPGVDGNT